MPPYEQMSAIILINLPLIQKHYTVFHPLPPPYLPLYGQRGSRGTPGASSTQSSRTGANTSSTTVPSGPAVASCRTFDGIVHVSPGPSSRVSSPIRNVMSR